MFESLLVEWLSGNTPLIKRWGEEIFIEMGSTYKYLLLEITAKG